jgi:hypothetical protein
MNIAQWRKKWLQWAFGSAMIFRGVAASDWVENPKGALPHADAQSVASWHCTSIPKGSAS